jgi:hypothetical protein
MSEALLAVSKLSAKGIPFDTFGTSDGLPNMARTLVHESHMDAIPEAGGLAVRPHDMPHSAANEAARTGEPAVVDSGLYKTIKCLLSRLKALVKVLVDALGSAWGASTPETLVPLSFLVVLVVVLYMRYAAKRNKEEIRSSYMSIDNRPFASDT